MLTQNSAPGPHPVPRAGIGSSAVDLPNLNRAEDLSSSQQSCHRDSNSSFYQLVRLTPQFEMYSTSSFYSEKLGASVTSCDDIAAKDTLIRGSLEG